MLDIRKSNERGSSEYSWLKSKFSFSFSSYYDPAHMGFRNLRVINEDYIKGHGGFDTHPHKDMEIITFMISGKIAHKDTLGNTSEIEAGEIQVMTAGRGIEHSEFNPLSEESHLYQIWIHPSLKNLDPGYKNFDYRNRIVENGLTLLASGDGDHVEVAKINQDAKFYLGQYSSGKFSIELDKKKFYWLQLVKSTLNINELKLVQGDGVSISEEIELSLLVDEKVQFLLFELS